MDLAAWWRSRRWVGLLDLIDQLPAACRLNEAIYNDPDTADRVAQALERRTGEEEPWAPRHSEWNLQHLMLQRLTYAVEKLDRDVVAIAGGDPSTPRPFPAPRTLVEVIAERRRHGRAHALIAVLTPDYA